MNKAAFFDRDGTINVNFGHVYRPEDLVFVSGVPERIAEYNRAGTLVIVVTNQAGIAKGMYTEAQMHQFHEYMNQQLRSRYGAHIDAFYFCPHHPDYTGPCGCRKPEAGMFFRAARDWQISLQDCVMYGDKESDKIAAEKAGIPEFHWVGQQALLLNMVKESELDHEGKIFSID